MGHSVPNCGRRLRISGGTDRTAQSFPTLFDKPPLSSLGCVKMATTSCGIAADLQAKLRYGLVKRWLLRGGVGALLTDISTTASHGKGSSPWQVTKGPPLQCPSMGRLCCRVPSGSSTLRRHAPRMCSARCHIGASLRLPKRWMLVCWPRRGAVIHVLNSTMMRLYILARPARLSAPAWRCRPAR